jgi:DNA polymerase III delta prime subunit
MKKMSEQNIPYIEKYRPQKFSEIVLEPYNKRFFENIIHKNSSTFPNILLYGPPGTGKTTSIINLINEYYKNSNENSVNGSNLIHLNASDERGIDIIRNQINLFIHSSGLFETGFKFVILDEVDYMTKSAQQALKYILQTFETKNVRFFLICNYISKIDESLQKEFVCIQFNQLPKNDISQFLIKICKKENIEWTQPKIDTIINIFHYDIRSMINFLQLNNSLDVMFSDVIETLHQLITLQDKPTIKQFIQTICLQYNINEKQVILDYFDFLLNQYLIEELNDQKLSLFINFMESIIHKFENESIIDYFIFHSIRNYITT